MRNLHQDVLAGYSKSIDEAELKNKVEVAVDFLGYCWFKKGIKMVSIREAEMFQEGGVKNELNDIIPF